MTADRAGAGLLAAFERQAQWCRAPAPFTARLLERSRAWLARDAGARAAFAAVSDDPLAGAVALRWAGALHHLALLGREPWAGIWPPAAAAHAAADDATHAAALDAALDAAIVSAWREQQPLVRAALARPPQTNEVQRSAVLLPGLLRVAAATRLPLALLEIGASAGLNLWCDRYRYDPGPWSWGDASRPLTLAASWRGPAPELEAPLAVARRAGCDLHPVELRAPGEALRLASFIWSEQRDRLARLRAACEAAAGWQAAEGVAVEAATASRFVARELAAPARGVATVLMHAVLWQYLDRAEQDAITAAVEAAGARATPDAPLAWLTLEPPAPDLGMQLGCRIWDGAARRGVRRLLARAHPHGASIEWLGGAA